MKGLQTQGFHRRDTSSEIEICLPPQFLRLPGSSTQKDTSRKLKELVAT